MHPFHIGVSVVLAVCGVGALIGYYQPHTNLLGISVFLGWWVTVAAMLIAFAIAVVLIFRSLTKNARGILVHSWLGLLNGVVASVPYAYMIFGPRVS
jgi:hypothetical protein